MEIDLTPRYYRALRQFVKNNRSNASNIKKCLEILRENPSHPSLNLEKLSGSRLWTARIDKANRIFFFRTDSSTLILIDIGPHDKYRKY